jgi:Spy/CpxP family protein refolding chaperone
MTIVKSMLSALFVGALLAAAPALRADDGNTKNAKSEHKRWDKFDHLKKQLELTDDQVAQWKAAEKSDREEGKVLRDKVKADLAELTVLLDQKASEGELKKALTGLEADHKAVEALKEKKIETFKGFLNPTQQSKLVVMMTGHKGGRGGWGHGPKGPQGGPEGGWEHGTEGE